MQPTGPRRARAALLRHDRRWRGLLVGAVLIGGLLWSRGMGTTASGVSSAGSAARTASQPTTLVKLDGARLGPSFQGIGAISGGGGNSRYLIDYPSRERATILDYLFKPHYGASLQLLKLEIGGDGNSSDGSEPSVEQVRGQISCNVGYELWLAKEAVKRDPHLALYGLQWSAPSWVRGSGNSLWTAADIHYLLDWLGCARRAGLRISYLGGWNEHYQAGSAVIEAWYVALRRALDANGYRSVEIVAADNLGVPASAAWSVADDMAANPAFGRAVAVIGVHDICGIESHGFGCAASARAAAWAASGHKLLWQSELGRTPSNGTNPLEEGPAGLARSLNRGYLDAGVTGTLLWPLVDSMPPTLPFSDRGLVVADQPWSGSYAVGALTWVVAQTTQFVAPGWRFLGGAAGKLDGTGTYVSYAAPNRSAWSAVVETSAATSPQRVRFELRGGLPSHVHVWYTDLGGRRQFVDLGSLTARNGSFSFPLQPHGLYTFTTTTGQSKANGHSPAPPAPKPLSPHLVAHPDAAGMASLLAPMEGSFQYVGGTLTQTTVGAPVAWSSCDVGFPYAVLGTTSWQHVTVATSVELPAAKPRSRPPASGLPGSGLPASGLPGSGLPASGLPGAFLVAGFDGASSPCDFSGYLFSVDSSGRWQLTRSSDRSASLASGRVAPAQHYELELAVSGRDLTGSIGTRRVVSFRAPAPIVGLAGLGSLTFGPVRFLRVTVG